MAKIILSRDLPQALVEDFLGLGNLCNADLRRLSYDVCWLMNDLRTNGNAAFILFSTSISREFTRDTYTVVGDHADAPFGGCGSRSARLHRTRTAGDEGMASLLLSSDEVRLRETMIALLWALSNPGEVKTLPVAADDSIYSIAQALLDSDATFYSPEKTLADRLERTGARWSPPHRARNHFYPTLLPDDLAGLELAPSGFATEPNASSTIVVGCTFGESIDRGTRGATWLRLTTREISRPIELELAGLPLEFWGVRDRAVRYPFGWDLLLVSGNKAVGIPRAVIAEVLP
jgi:alpha-D-ribose 1-methylphosphonate 5-triphosphate synthase subunit PhnH